MSNTRLIKHEASNLYFVDSAKIKVFPCAYRGYTAETGQAHTIFDPESRLNTEKNLIKPTGKLGCKDSYIINATSNSLHMNFHGYDIIIDDISASDFVINEPDGSTIILIPTIQLKLLNLDVTEQQAKTKVLASWLGEECLDFPYQLSTPPTDYSGYVFTGLAFCTATQIMDNETVSLQSFVVENHDIGAHWIYNNTYFIPTIELNQAGDTVISDSNFIIDRGNTTVTNGNLCVKSTTGSTVDTVFAVDLHTKQTTATSITATGLAVDQATLGTDSGNVVLNGQLIANKQAEFNSTIKIGQDAVNITSEKFDVNLPMSVDKEFVLGDDKQDLVFSIDTDMREVIIGTPAQDPVFSVDTDSKEVTISNGATLMVDNKAVLSGVSIENNNLQAEMATITDTLQVDKVTSHNGTINILCDDLQVDSSLTADSLSTNGTLNVSGTATLDGGANIKTQLALKNGQNKEVAVIRPDATGTSSFIDIDGRGIGEGTSVRGVVKFKDSTTSATNKVTINPDDSVGKVLSVAGTVYAQKVQVTSAPTSAEDAVRKTELDAISARLDALGFKQGDITDMSTSYISGGKFYKMGKMFCGQLTLTGETAYQADYVKIGTMPDWINLQADIICTFKLITARIHDSGNDTTQITIKLSASDRGIHRMATSPGSKRDSSKTPRILATWYFDENDTQHLCFAAATGADET